MKITVEANTDVSNLRDLPRKVFNAAGVATLVGFRTKTMDKVPMPIFIEYRDDKARGLTVLGDPNVSKWVENTKKAMSWQYAKTSTDFIPAEIATMISLVTVDTGVLIGMKTIFVDVYLQLFLRPILFSSFDCFFQVCARRSRMLFPISKR